MIDPGILSEDRLVRRFPSGHRRAGRRRAPGSPGRAIARDLAAVVACRRSTCCSWARGALHPFRAVRGHAAFARSILVDTAVCLASGLLGFRATRVAQMVTPYSWINERAGLLPGAAAATASKSAASEVTLPRLRLNRRGLSCASVPPVHQRREHR